MDWLWKKVWSNRYDTEYDIDCRVEDALRAYSAGGWRISKQVLPAIAAEIGRLDKECVESFDRLIWCGVLKPKVYAPPKPTVYRVTNKHVRRTPLGGERFRAPLRRDGASWGPWTIAEQTHERVEISDAQIKEIMAAVVAHRPKGLSIDAKEELAQDVLLAVISGSMTIEDIPLKMAGFAARATVGTSSEHKHSTWESDL